ncbi:MAG: GGDEF domain-containing protein [Magnetococcus sp. DMHC-1]|nr:GGDEF domain-containing protein [Magnetococcales bacterium]
MDTMETFLEKVLKGLERDPPATAEAKRLLKDMLVRQPWTASINDARAVGSLLLDTLVKPVLSQDREREADVERLSRQIRTANPLSPATVAAPVNQIATWIKELMVNPGSRDAGPPETFRERLLIILRQLGNKDSRLAEAVNKLGPPGTEVSWKDLHTLLSGMIIQEEMGRTLWQQERDELKSTLLDIVFQFNAMLQNMGRPGENTEQTIATLRTQERSTDLEELKKLLLHEVEEFQQYARSLQEQREESRVMLVRARDRLQQMETALTASQDEQLLDPVSGLPNRFSFSAHLTRNRERALHLQEPFALLLCRMENLGTLLEGMAEKEGRRLILALVKRIRGKTGPDPYLARLSVEVFAIILPRGNLEQTRSMANQLQELFENLRFRLGNQSLLVRPAFGGAIHHATWDERTMLTQADEALYAAQAMKNPGARIQIAEYRPPAEPEASV